MCFSAPSPQIIQPAAAPPPAPPLPPLAPPKAPELDPQATNKKQSAAAGRTGTSVFRNDLAIPSAGPVGAGINIPR